MSFNMFSKNIQIKFLSGLISFMTIVSVIQVAHAQYPKDDKQRMVKYKTDKEITVGAAQFSKYLPDLQGKKVGLVVNQTSVVGNTHLVDTLLSLKVNVARIFGPEHGFRGNAAAGKHVADEKDGKTGIAVVSLYGSNKKPGAEQIKDLDVLIFDIQDVGARFYTYISTMTYVMEACAENNKKVIVLDRPNPNGYYVDGPVLEKGFESFVGMHPVPIVHGMTVGEYAKMVNGEKWLSGQKIADLKIIPCLNYNHSDHYKLPVKPSPNIQNMEAVYLYPTLCLFEGTVMSVGRGTDKPFQVLGHPSMKDANYKFTPQSIPGVSDSPKFKGQECYGYDLSDFSVFYLKDTGSIYIFWLIDSFKRLNMGPSFFTDYFDKLAGNKTLREQIIKGVSEQEIRKSWEKGIEEFKSIRSKYLLYPDFVELKK